MVDRRAVSSIVGVILIVGLTLGTITAILAVGSGVLGDSQNDAHVYQMENAMSQMASKASLVGLDESDRQDFHLGGVGEGEVEVDPDAGSIKVIHEDANGSSTTLMDQPFGAVIYRFGDQEIAYQGGGVWKKYETGGSMLSPPEFHYKSRTLTFPIIRVSETADVSKSSRGSITPANTSQRIYPDGSFTNPLENGTVIVEIQSDYHWAWNRYFTERTDAAVEHFPGNKTIRVDLSVPFEEKFNAAVTTTESDGIDVHGGDVPDDWESGEQYPSASDEVDDRIADCKAGMCNNTSYGAGTTLYGNETYYIDTDASGDQTFDTSAGNITLVIDGDLDVGGDNLEIQGNNSVTVFIRGSYSVGGNGAVNAGNPAEQLVMYFHSDSPGNPTVDLGSGTPEMSGAIYAPNSDAKLSGNAEFNGAIIVEEITVNGDPANVIEYDDSLLDEELAVTNPPDQIKYLHVTDNEIAVELD